MGSQFIQNGEQKVVYPSAPAVLMPGVLVSCSLGDSSLGSGTWALLLWWRHYPPFQPQVSLGLERCPGQRKG